jgi:hypothetical protein
MPLRLQTENLLLHCKGNGKFNPRTGHKGPEEEHMYSSTLSLTSTLDEAEWSMPCPGWLTLEARPGTHCMGGWVGSRAFLSGHGKLRPPPGFDARTVQPVPKLLYRLCYKQILKSDNYSTANLAVCNFDSYHTIFSVYDIQLYFKKHILMRT